MLQEAISLLPADRSIPVDLLNDPQRAAVPEAVEPVDSDTQAASTFAPAPDVSPALAQIFAAPGSSVGVRTRADVASFARLASDQSPAAPVRPLVEPAESPEAWLRFVTPLPHVAGPDVAGVVLGTLVSHRRWQSDFVVSQGSRGTCWAFAGIAALEAAYARRGIRVKLSEQYLFHISKAHENQGVGPGINSLIGFQGSSDVVHHLTWWNMPLYAHAPYVDEPALQALANSIDGTGGGLKNAGGGTREQADWFEFDLRNIPLHARWFAQYGAAGYGTLSNYSVADLKAVIAAGHDVVIDVWDNAGVGGHCMLAYGYDDVAQAFLIKNSQSLPGFETMLYSGDPRFQLRTTRAYYITAVRTPQTQWAAMWVGRWEIDHDGWRGRLVIRRFLDVHSDKGLPAPNAPIGLGTWYGEDGRELPVDGGFVDGGRGLRCAIGGQPFEIYLHTRDPYRAAGRCFWNNRWFGAVLSRGTAVGAGSGFDRSETIGLWDATHDGWRGEMRIGVDPAYVQAADGGARKAWIDPGAIGHQVDLHVDFGGNNRDQRFQLLHHTREDGVLGGVTRWSGRDWPVEGRMSANLYLVAADGRLRWYRHVGRYRQAFDWDPERQVGTGWNGFRAVFGGGDGVIYAIRPDGKLLWYYHEGRNQGQYTWRGPSEVGTGWSSFARVFAGDGGTIYAVRPDGGLLWYRHLGRRDGSSRWVGPGEVGTGWGGFVTLAAGPDGTIYGTLPDGRMLWYRHFGHDHGYRIWHGQIEVGTGWQLYDRIWIAGNGFVYGRRTDGELWCWRHHGFLTGARDWSEGRRVGTGWGGANVRDVVLT